MTMAPRSSSSDRPTGPKRSTSPSRGSPDPWSDSVYEELRKLAASHMKRERIDHTLQPTALANEAYARLADFTRLHGRDRAGFLALAAVQIRRILVDHARRRMAKKRTGGAVRVTFDEKIHAAASQGVDIGALDDLLIDLAERSSRQARVVELRFFGGMTIEEIALAVEVSPRTVKNDWRTARAWLAAQLT